MFVYVWFSSATLDFGCFGICGLQGLLQGRTKKGLQMLGIGPAKDPGVMPLLGIFYLCRHDVSFLGNCPAFRFDWKFFVWKQRGAGFKPFPDSQCSLPMVVS
jgi:hypothetical protein